MAPDFDEQDLVQAFFGYDRTKDESLFWSWEVFYSGWDRRDEKLALVLALIEGAPDDRGLLLVGAGPLEDLLWKCGGAVIGRIEVAAQADARLRLALDNVRGLDRYLEIEARVRRILATAHPGSTPPH